MCSNVGSTRVEVQWNIFMQLDRYISSGAHGSNVKWMHANAPGPIIDCIVFIWGIQIDMVITYLHKKYLVYMA